MKNLLKKIIPYILGVKIRGLYQKILKFYYSGDTLYCPFCQNSFRKLLPGGFNLPVINEKKIIGAGYRENNICPRCYSTDRDRLIYLYLKEKTNIFTQNIKLLHIAPEGSIKSLIQQYPNITYSQGDKFENGYRGYYYDRKVNQMDITQIPFPDDTFDVIICNHVLEHIENDKKAMEELYRVLKPNGWAIIQVPISQTLANTFEAEANSPEERERLFGQFDHVRIYGQDYPSLLENVGFAVSIHNPVRDGWNINHDYYAINTLENIYVAYK
ncbi:MAG: methyltransferase domain-containing protein [Lentimicrobiaceae bacterium]|nr:methyltransferase domain-containing protein [Lentimicrobiaceae bacterium]